MPQRKQAYRENGIYHIYNRGIDKRLIVEDDEDRERCIYGLFVSNDKRPVLNSYHHFKQRHKKRDGDEERKLLVKILAFCLMPNHFHLLLKPQSKEAIPRFMQKFGSGYNRYFNEKHERMGPLFQGRYKVAPIDEKEHYAWIPYYIHCNPLDLEMPKWRERNLKNIKEALQYLENYKWSSHRDYLGIENFPEVTQREFLKADVGTGKKYKANIKEWIQTCSTEDKGNLTLEPHSTIL